VPDPRRLFFAAEAGAAARAFWVRIYAPLLIRTRPLPEVLRRLDRSRRTGDAAGPLDPRTLPAVERVVAALRVIPNTCLYRALARYNVLSGLQEGVRFVMGVRKQDDGKLIGHAWLEHHGQPLGEALDPRLVVTFTYPPS
jgi:hypothetical protein